MGYLPTYYLSMADINTRPLDRELKKGSAEPLILSLLDALRGQRVLAQQRKTWAAFVAAVRRVTGDEHA